MRTLRLSAAMSLDGFIATKDGGYDWIPMDPDIDFSAMFSRYDTVLMGRKSYQAAKAQGGGGMPGMAAYVVSRTWNPGDEPGVTVTADLAGTVKRLKNEPGKDLWLFGGGELFRAAFDQDLVDEVEIAIVPVLLGGGIPLLSPGEGRFPLRLVSQRVFEKTGTLLLEYARGAANSR